MNRPSLPTLISELLFSKVAHDLASPVGATENGLELLAEDDAAMAEEAMALVRQSAHSVASRLRFFRLCYGTSGGSKGLTPDAVRQVLQEFYRYEQRLRLHITDTAPLDEHSARLLFCLVLCASDALPYGGTLSLSWNDQGLHLHGVSARPERGIKRGTFLPYFPGAPVPEDISAYTVHGWFTGFLAASHGFTVQLEEEDNSSALRITAHKA